MSGPQKVTVCTAFDTTLPGFIVVIRVPMEDGGGFDVCLLPDQARYIGARLAEMAADADRKNVAAQEPAAGSVQ